MQINQLHPINKSRQKRRVGRGGKRGTYSGRGMKGQKARAGHKIRPAIRDLIKQMPKNRGYRFKSIQAQPAILNLRDIEKAFDSGSTVTPEVLLKKGMVRRTGGRLPAVKVLGSGKIAKKINFSGIKISRPARALVEKAGGTIK